MHVEWKIVTGNPQVASKLNEFASVLHMQHQPEACASDLGDDQSCYLLIRLIDCLIDWLIDCMLWLQRLILSRSSSVKERLSGTAALCGVCAYIRIICSADLQTKLSRSTNGFCDCDWLLPFSDYTIHLYTAAVRYYSSHLYSQLKSF